MLLFNAIHLHHHFFLLPALFTGDVIFLRLVNSLGANIMWNHVRGLFPFIFFFLTNFYFILFIHFTGLSIIIQSLSLFYFSLPFSSFEQVIFNLTVFTRFTNEMMRHNKKLLITFYSATIFFFLFFHWSVLLSFCLPYSRCNEIQHLIFKFSSLCMSFFFFYFCFYFSSLLFIYSSSYKVVEIERQRAAEKKER